MTMPRVESWPTEDVHDLTPEVCTQRIEDLTERVIACRCECPALLLDLARWKQRLLDLTVI